MTGRRGLIMVAASLAGWAAVPLLCWVAWLAGQHLSLTAFVVWGCALTAATVIALQAGSWLASEIAAQRAVGAKLRYLPGYWLAVLIHGDPDSEPPS